VPEFSGSGKIYVNVLALSSKKIFRLQAAPLLKKFKNAKCVKFSPLGWIYALF
jgi:hypothetical protein